MTLIKIQKKNINPNVLGEDEDIRKRCPECWRFINLERHSIFCKAGKKETNL